MINSKIRVRFAPSPTGSLHLGGARTALYNYLFAKKYGGHFILRVEDTDIERSSEAALREQLADLNWLGLHWNEGPDPHTLENHGEYGPYRQSERLQIYQQHIQQLLAQGQAYYCFLTDDDIKQQRRLAEQTGKPYQVVSPYRDLAPAEAKKRLERRESATIRLKTPKEKVIYEFDDLIRGHITLPSDMVGDFVLMRSDGMPVYNFSCVIDDALMKISHVFRGEEHLSNTLRQLMLYQAFGYDIPQFAHLSIILGSDRKKLSKREAAVSCNDFRAQGYLAQAILNYTALLGWTDKNGREIFRLSELVDAFATEDLNASAAIFDRKKLQWINAQHIRQLPPQQLWQAIEPFLQQADIILPDDQHWRGKALSLFAVNLETLADVITYFQPLDERKFVIGEDAIEVLQWPSTKIVIEQWLKLLEDFDGTMLNESDFKQMLDAIKSACQVKGKQLFMPIRVAVIGQPHGAELKLLIQLLTKKQLISRAQQCLRD